MFVKFNMEKFEKKVSFHRKDDSMESLWDCDLDNINTLWVSPKSRKNSFTYEIPFTDEGKLGLSLKYSTKEKKLYILEIDTDINPHLKELKNEIPKKSSLFMFNNNIIRDNKHFIELLKIAKNQNEEYKKYFEKKKIKNISPLKFQIVLKRNNFV